MLPCEAQDPLGALRQEQGLAVLAAFFCLLFFAAAKKSRCRPAQGRRVKQANKTRMPAQEQKAKAHQHRLRSKKTKPIHRDRGAKISAPSEEQRSSRRASLPRNSTGCVVSESLAGTLPSALIHTRSPRCNRNVSPICNQ